MTHGIRARWRLQLPGVGLIEVVASDLALAAQDEENSLPDRLEVGPRKEPLVPSAGSPISTSDSVMPLITTKCS